MPSAPRPAGTPRPASSPQADADPAKLVSGDALRVSRGAANGSAAGRRGWAGWAASLLLTVVFGARILEHYAGTPQSALAAGLLATFMVLCLALPLVARRGRWLGHVYFALQSAVAAILMFVPPYFDAVTALCVALALQAALVLPRRALVGWIAILVLLTAVPSVLLFGWVRGLALMLIPAAGCILVPAYVIANQEIETARLESQRLLEELQAAQRRLRAYAAQAEELAAVEARNRLERELHDSVSQTLFSLSLNARAARLYLERDPARLRPQLERLQALAQDALTEIRGLIEQLRPASDGPE